MNKKKYIYSNRKEIEMKNANQTNANQSNDINSKESKITKIPDKVPEKIPENVEPPNGKEKDSFLFINFFFDLLFVFTEKPLFLFDDFEDLVE